MRTRVSYRLVKQWAAALLLLSVVCLTVQPRPARAAQPAGDPGPALIMKVEAYPDDTVCVGDTAPFLVSVVDGHHVAVPGATVLADGQPHVTDEWGKTYWSRDFDAKGDISWTLSVSKPGYSPDIDVHSSTLVVDCYWKIGLGYGDFFRDKKSDWVFSSEVELPKGVPFKADASGRLALEGQSSLPARYSGEAYLFSKGFDCTVDPDLIGTYDLKFDGTLNGQRLTIQLSGDPPKLPGQVNIQCVDQHGGVAGKLQHVVTQETMDLIKWSHPSLSRFSLDKEGGTVHFTLDQSLIWAVPSHEARGEVYVQKVKGQ